MKNIAPLILLILAAWFYQAGAQEACSRIKTIQEKKLVDKIIISYHLYNCMDGTILQGLSHPTCAPLAARLKEYICRLVGKGIPEDHIYDALDRRAQTMVAFEKPAIPDLTNAPVAGNDTSNVMLTVFLCSLCPFCRIIIPELYQSVMNGRLRSKVCLHVKLFPIKGHPCSVEGGLALEAAARLGRFWDYLMVMYKQYDSFSVPILNQWADSIGLDKTAFDSLRTSAMVYQDVSDSKKEGIRLGVAETPSFFINGRKYTADMDIETLTDIIEEEYEKDRRDIKRKGN